MKPENLSGLLERTPPLLEACVVDDIPTLRALRLVNKDSARVALLGLNEYTAAFLGGAKDTNISGVSLLQKARLLHLTVPLQLAGRLGVSNMFAHR